MLAIGGDVGLCINPIDEGPRVRIHFAPAVSHANSCTELRKCAQACREPDQGRCEDRQSWPLARASPRDLCRPADIFPPPYFDLTAARADLEVAGFGAVSIEKLPERSRAKSPQEAAIANCHGGILRTHIEQHAPGRPEEITNAVADALAEKFGAGPIDAPMQAILFTASR